MRNFSIQKREPNQNSAYNNSLLGAQYAGSQHAGNTFGQLTPSPQRPGQGGSG